VISPLLGWPNIPYSADTDQNANSPDDCLGSYPAYLEADNDNDGDGTKNPDDTFPLDASEQLDTDSDGIGNNADVYPENNLYSKDSDSDGMPNEWETEYGLDPNDLSDATSDRDNVGVTALDEFLAGTIPSGSLDIDGNDDYDALSDGLILLRGIFGLDLSALQRFVRFL